MMWLADSITVDHVDRKHHASERVTNVRNLQSLFNQLFNLLITAAFSLGVFIPYHSLQLLRLNLNNLVDERRDIVLAQMVDGVVPVVDIALVFPLGELTGVDSSEVAHEDVVAHRVRQVGDRLVSALHHPRLRIVKYTMLQVDHTECSLVTDPVHVNHITIFCLALVLLVLEAIRAHQVPHGSLVHVPLH